MVLTHGYMTLEIILSNLHLWGYLAGKMTPYKAYLTACSWTLDPSCILFYNGDSTFRLKRLALFESMLLPL